MSKMTEEIAAELLDVTQYCDDGDLVHRDDGLGVGELRELIAAWRTVQKLPKTADGVAIVPHGNLWAVIDVSAIDGVDKPFVVAGGFVSMNFDADRCFGIVRTCDGEEFEVAVDDCYSTESAARAAMEGK